MKMFSESAMSLMNKIITFFVGYMIVVMFLFSLMIYFVDHSSMKAVNDNYSKDVAAMESAMVTNWLEDSENILHSLSGVFGLLDGDLVTYIDELKFVQQENSNKFKHLFIVDSNHNYIDTFDLETTMTGDMIDSVLDGSEKSIITSPQMHPVLSEALFTILVPVRDNGNIIGALGATLTMNELSSRLDAYEVAGAGFGWLVDENLTVIAHPKSEHILKMSLLSSDELKEKEFINNKLSPSNELGFSGLDKISKIILELNTATVKYTDPDGYDRTVSFSPVKGTNGWLVAFTTFNDRLPSTTNNLLIYMGLALLIIVVVSVFASYILASEITKPINQLIHVVNLFINGNKGVRANMKLNDEIGQLGSAFNGMADTIIEHTDNVEELIQERTHMLADLNYQIVARNKDLDTMNKELETTNTKLHSLATTDMLTGLQNRHELVRTMQSFMDDVLQGEDPGFSVLFVDLDNFKYYNDTFSHEIGDYILIEVGKILVDNVRELDMVARYGGDEFVILLKHGEFDISKMLSERIHAKILEQKGFRKQIERKIGSEIMHLGKNMLSCSIGIVNYNRNVGAKTVDDLLALADETMYKAKKAGKSRIVVN